MKRQIELSCEECNCVAFRLITTETATIAKCAECGTEQVIKWR